MTEVAIPVIAGLIGEETVREGDGSMTHLGGSGCYAALGASLFGPTRLVGIGAERCLDDLRALSNGSTIDISLVQICPGSGFRYAISYMNDNHSLRTFEANWGMTPLFDYTLDEPATGLNVFLAADDPARQLRFVRGHPGIVYGLGISEHFIPDFRNEYRRLIEGARLVVLNKRELSLLEIAEIDTKALVIVTDGPRSITIGCDRESFEQHVQFDRDVVDPTGCGDVLAGAFFAAWASTGFNKHRVRENIGCAIQASQLALMSRGALDLMRLQAGSTLAQG